MVTVLQELVQCCSDRNESIPILKEILSTLTTSKQRYLIDVEDRTNRSALFHAIETKKSIEFIKEILDFNAKITSRILLSAIRHGNLSILHLLKYYGADFRPGTDGVSLLHECVLLHKNHFIEFLITEGNIDPDVLDFDHQSPLLHAIFRTNIEAIEILLSYSLRDPSSVGTRKRSLTCLHVASEIGIDEVLPSLLRRCSTVNINRLSSYDQTPFDLFVSCYLFTKSSLFINDKSIDLFSSLFDLFVENGAKLHHLTRAYRRTRAPFVTKILTLLLRKNLEFSSIILPTNEATIFEGIRTLVCDSLVDWPYLLEANDTLTSKQISRVLAELYDLFLLAFFKSINRMEINQKFLRKNCLPNAQSSKIKKVLWNFIENFIEKEKQPKTLKSICRTKILLKQKSIQTVSDVPQYLQNFLLFLE